MNWEYESGPHQITGNGVGFKPDILDMDVMEKVLEVSVTDGLFDDYGFPQEK